MKSVIKESKKALGELDEETVIKDLKEKLDYKELREDIKEFRKKFAQLIEAAGIEKLVIFVDELDRCSPNTILDTLEAMKIFLFEGKVAFVIGADERHVSYARDITYIASGGIRSTKPLVWQGFAPLSELLFSCAVLKRNRTALKRSRLPP